MAKEIINIPLTPQKIVLEGDSIRRNSSGKIGFQSNGPKILSRYLSTSMGSCHDFCKYGIKHASEAKGKSPMPKRITAVTDEGQNLLKIPTLAKKKKMLLIRKASADSKTGVHDNSLVIEIEVPSSAKRVAVPKNDSSLPGKGTNVSTRRSSDLKLKHFPTRPSSLSMAEQMSIKTNSNIRISKKMEDHLKNALEGPSITRNCGTGTDKEMETSNLGEREVSMHLAVSFSPKTFVSRVSNKKAGNAENLKGACPKNRNITTKTKALQVTDENFSEKTVHIINPEAGNKVDGSTQNGTHTIQLSPSLTPSSEGKGLRHSSTKTRSTTSSASSKSKNVRCTRNVIDQTKLHPLLSSSSEKKILRHPQNGTHRTRLSSSSPSSSTMSRSESTVTEESGAVSEHNETESKKQTSNLKVESKGRPRRGGICSLGSKNHSPRKLHFRDGKVNDPQSENNTPRRLKFRRGRVLGENYNGKNDTLWRNFKRREVVHSELNGTKAKSEKVVLRHQDVEGKKDFQSLFNNVIEETASKLVKTKKSKVKALVGAFETIISLQETRPVAVTSIC